MEKKDSLSKPIRSLCVILAVIAGLSCGSDCSSTPTTQTIPDHVADVQSMSSVSRVPTVSG